MYYLHHHRSKLRDSIREIVFGAEDGMVSTLGALTGIAVGSGDQQTVLLAGVVIIGVESVSMSIGSFLSARSVRYVEQRALMEESHQIQHYAKQEFSELRELFIRDGWPADLAQTMAETASVDQELMHREMAYRELKIVPDKSAVPLQDSMFMFAAYILGGLVPLASYLLLPFQTAVVASLAVTFLGLFGLGVVTSYFTRRNWLRSGSEMLLLASVAAVIGYAIGIFLT